MTHAPTSVLPREQPEAEVRPVREPSDQVLLERFVTQGDQAAFTGLVERYGKSVWGLCRRLLRQEQDAEDAFQAVFIILAQKAASIRKGEAVGSWLYGVAYRTAMRARRTAARRWNHEKQAVRSGETGEQPWAGEACRELQRLLDEEIQRLAEKYRAPFILCCLEGMGRAEAARELRLKEGTLSARLARARKVLETRLTRRGVALAGALAAGALTANTASAAPVTLVLAAAHGALASLSGTTAATSASPTSASPTSASPTSASPTSASPTALALARTVMRTMPAAKLKAALVLLAGVSVVMVAGILAAMQLLGDDVLDPDTFVAPPHALGTAVDEQVFAVAFSPDGKRLVTAGGRHVLPGQLQIWDTASAKNLVTIRGIPGVLSVAFAPDGHSFATGDFSGDVKLRDAITGEERAAVKGHKAAVHSVTFSPDGKSLVSAGADRTLKLWSVPGLEERRAIAGHSDMILSAAFFHHSPAIVSGSQDKTAVVWNASTGEQKVVLKGHTAAVQAVAISPDDQIIATASWDRTIKLWDAATGKEQAVLDEPDATPYSLSFSPDGKLLASARSDGQVRLWDMKTHKPAGELRKHAAAAWAVRFSGDGKLLASGSSDRTANIWHIKAGKGGVPPVKTLTTASPLIRPILALAYAPDGSYLAMAARGTPIQIRDSKSGDVLRTLAGHTGEVSCLAFSPDGRTLASASADASIKLWDPATGKERKTLSHAGPVHALAFTPDGARIASGGADKKIRIWDAASGEQLDLFQGHDAAVRALTFSPDGRRLVSGSDDRTVKVWDVPRGKAPVTLKGHAGGVRALAFAAGETLVSGSEDGTVKLWELTQGQCRLSLTAHAGGVRAIAVTPSGRILATCGQDNDLRVWDAATGELRATLAGHTAAVAALAIQPRGKYLLSGGEDTLLLRWRGAKRAVVIPPAAAPAFKAPAPAEPLPPAPPLRTDYPQQFYREFRGNQLVPPLHISGPDADLFTHPEDKGVRVTLPAQRNGKDPVGIVCTAPVDGDFEITVGYEILQAERPKTGHAVGFELYLMAAVPGADALTMMRVVRPWGGETLYCGHNFMENGRRRFLHHDTPATSRTGRFRVVRNGSMARFFAAEGDAGEWRELHRYPFVTNPLAMVRLSAYPGQSNTEPVAVRITDLRIRAENLGDELIAVEVDEDAAGWLVAVLIVGSAAVVLGGVAFYLRRRRRRPALQPESEQPANGEAAASFACSGCGKRLKARPELAGRKVKCPQCGRALHVPAVDAPVSSTHITDAGHRR